MFPKHPLIFVKTVIKPLMIWQTATKDEKRGISVLKIAVVVAQDRNGNIIARKAGTGC